MNEKKQKKGANLRLTWQRILSYINTYFYVIYARLAAIYYCRRYCCKKISNFMSFHSYYVCKSMFAHENFSMNIRN